MCITNQSILLQGHLSSYSGISTTVILRLLYWDFFNMLNVTRYNKVLDKCFANIKSAYKAKSLPPLSNSDHSTIHLIPMYRSTLKSSKLQRKTVLDVILVQL